jgi:hypothetical protein
MLIKIPEDGSERYEAIEFLLQRITDIGGELKPSELEWAIKMEDAYNKYGNLSDKQVKILVDILVKHQD